MRPGLIPLLAGFVFWAVMFSALYGLQALGCAFGWPEGLHRTVLVSVWIASIVTMSIGLRLAWLRSAGSSDTLARVSVGVTLAALASLVATLFPVTFATLCQ